MPKPVVRDYEVTEGEAIGITLKVLPHEPKDVFRGNMLHVCCGCGMRHLITFETLTKAKQRLMLILRFFVI
jgi:hypothetical protein